MNLGVHKATAKIRRPKTAAENEDQVSEEDRALHEELAEEIVSRLLDSGEDGEEETDNFADFYGFLAKKAVELAKAYQPKLRDGIKVAVEMVNSVAKDEQDGDVDIRVRIAPNTIDLPFVVDWAVDATTTLTTAEESEVLKLEGGKDVISLLQDLKSKKQDDLYISSIKELRVMFALPKNSIFVGGHIAKSDNCIFFEKAHNLATVLPKLGEIDIFADNTAIEVKSESWAKKEKYNDQSLKQFRRYRAMKDGSLAIFLNSSQLQIEKTILQVESNEIHAKLLNLLIQENFFDEVRLGNGTIINRSALNFKKKKNVKKWASSRRNNFLISSETEFRSIP